MKTVFVSGCFDILHPGHIQLLDFAAKQGDKLIVGLNTDQSVRALKGPTRPIQSANDRAVVLLALTAVDHVIWFETQRPEELIELLRPDVIVMGREHWDEVKDKPYASKVVLFDRTPHSTTMILDKIVRTYRRDG